MKRIIAAVALYFGLVQPVLAGFDEGAAAYQRGDYAAALRELRPLAERGRAEAQLGLGAMYANGQGVPQDYREAVRWYRKAAEQGDARAYFALGLTYDVGQGVPQDYAEAYKWFNLAAALLSDGSLRKIAAKRRDDVATKMTPGQIAEAQKLAREWMAAFGERGGN